MTVQDRLETAASALKEYNQDNISAIDDMSPEDIAKVASDFNIKTTDYPKLIGTMIYIRKRLVEKKGRVTSFKAAFPERCITTRMDTGSDFETAGEIGDPLHKTTIDIKAKRLEASQMYINVYQLLQSNLYINYAVDRMRVLDEALHMAMDQEVLPRDRDRYMKIFLEETRKPEGAKQLEVNMNLTHNDVTVVSVEERMTEISKKLEGATAAEIIELVHKPSEE